MIYVDVAKGIGGGLQNRPRWFDSNHRLQHRRNRDWTEKQRRLLSGPMWVRIPPIAPNIGIW